MSETLTIQLGTEAAEQLRRAAAAAGETAESLAQRLIEDAAADLADPRTESVLTDEQVAELERRMKEPRRFATDDEVEAFFARFMLAKK